MKKLALLLTCLPLLMTSCSKDEDLTKPDGLAGTVWRHDDESTSSRRAHTVIVFEDNYYTKTMTSAYYREGRWEESVYHEDRDAYVYTPPVVTFSYSGSTATGTISGRELTINWVALEEVYTKQ
jgi:hypothetical protein